MRRAPSRQNTGASTSSPGGARRTMSWKKQQSSAAPTPHLIEDVFPVYKLDWETLKAFLDEKFPGYVCASYSVRDDKYVFNIPEQLTEDDKKKIGKRRNDTSRSTEFIAESDNDDFEKWAVFEGWVHCHYSCSRVNQGIFGGHFYETGFTTTEYLSELRLICTIFLNHRTASMHIAPKFLLSYRGLENYPQNLINQTSSPAAIKAYKSRLDRVSNKLFENNDEEIHVPFRDLDPSTPEPQKRNILNDMALKEWLGDKSTVDPLSSTLTGEPVTKKDPKCRFIFIWAGHSRKPLRITKKMFLRMMSYFQVMPAFLDFVSVFGSQTNPRDLRYSGFREQIILTDSLRSPRIPDLGRSGRQYQLSYNLKSVERISPPDPGAKPWSIRQAAFHHQFDVREGTTLWIIVKGDLSLKDKIQETTGKNGRPEDRALNSPEECFGSSLTIHLVYSHWATSEWRSYIQWLEERIDGTSQALWSIRPGNPARYEYKPEDVQYVQTYEDQINEAIMILESNVEVLSSLCGFYEKLIKRKDFPMQDILEDYIAVFSSQINDMKADLKMQISRAKLLVRITSDRKNLILQHLQSQTAEKMENLTESMHTIGIMSQKEAIAMRIITVVTLVYLPATFVSTLFSTDIVKYQNTQGNLGSYSEIAMLRWLEVTIPLTLITLAIGYFAFKMANKQRQREWVKGLPLYNIIK